MMLPLGQLLQLVPRFTKSLKSALSSPNLAMTPTFFINLGEEPAVVDTNSPTVKIIIKGNDVLGNIIDGGYLANVINRRTCDTLGIREWESCPFWLQMVDTSLVRPSKLI